MQKIKVTRPPLQETITPVAKIKIGGKEIEAPFYGTMIRKPWELDLVCEHFNALHGGVSAVVFPEEKAGEIIAERERLLGQKRLGDFAGDIQEPVYQHIKKNCLWFSNPNEKDEATAQAWKDFSEDPTKHMHAIMANLSKQSKIKPDFYVPEVPFISADSPKYLVQAWKEIVKTTGNLAQNNFDSTVAIPLYANVNNFRRTEIWTELMENLRKATEAEQFAESSVILLQVEGIQELAEDTADVKLNFRDAVTELAQYALDSKKALIMLGASSEGYFSFANGINGFIEPMNGVLGSGFARSKEHRGRYYHRDEMKFYRFLGIEDIYRNKGHLPCTCRICEDLSKRWGSFSQTDWNHGRRLHLLASRQEEMQELKKDLTSLGLRIGLMDRINRSGLKNLVEAFHL